MKKISLSQLQDGFRKSMGSENIHIKAFKDKDGKIFEGSELKKLMEVPSGS